jgi:sulfur-carrier protein
MKVLYFAWLREKIGLSEESVTPPSDVGDVAGLVSWMCSRNGGYKEAFSDISSVRVAVNQEHVSLEHPVKKGDEIAFFPPVTGG